MNLFGWNISVTKAQSFGGTTSGSYSSIMQPVNHIAKLTRRSESDLVNLYRDTAYYCANLNARGVARTPLLMYRKHGVGMTMGKRYRKATKQATTRLKALGYIGDDDDVDEILAHPFLELLDKPFVEDDTGVMGRFTFLELTQLYLEDIGRAYWLIDATKEGMPLQLFPLIANNVEAWKATDSERFVDKYKYQTGRGIVEYEPKQIVPFLCPDLRNPYTGGYSPMQAASDRVGVNLSYLAQTQALLNNRARPDVIISPKDASQPYGQSQAKRMMQWFKQMFGGPNAGLPLVTHEAVDVTPLTFPPKDMGEQADDENTVKQIARIFDVPLSMIDKDANRANAEEGRKQHANDALFPRMRRMADQINAYLMPRYDRKGQTFVCFDEPYHQPLTVEAKDVKALIDAQVFVPDEVREMFGWGPMSAADKAELEKRRQDELNAKKPVVPPGAAANGSKVLEYRAAIRSGRPVNLNGCSH